MTRKLASIQEILEIRAITGADAICQYRINDWWVVDKINQYKVGDIVVYCEIDSFIKTGEYTAFLSKGKEPKVYKGIKGERLRTIKLRGALSQGLILPTAIIPDRVFTVEHIGEDVTDVLGIVKWELELPAQLAGQVNGTFPSYIPKTDQERAQNLKAQIFQTEDTWTPVQNDVDENTIQRLIAAGKFRYNGEVLERFTEAQAQPNAHYEVTMKMDGSSITNWFDPVKFEPCVASRNYELKVNDDNQGNSFVRMHLDSGLNQVLPIIFERTGIAYAVQGELMGAGIQGNREMLKFNQLFVFDVFNITEQRYLTPAERKAFMEMLYEFPQINKDIVLHAPIMHYDVTLAKLGLNDVQDLLNFAEGKSLVNHVREGVVFKRMDGKFSFKAISNTYLIQTKG